MKKIKEVLEGGYIILNRNNKSGRLFIKKKAILLKVIKLMNGHMRTPKIEALHRIIEWFNNEIIYDQIVPLGLDSSPLSSNSWLAGFIEADGNFYFSINLVKNLNLSI